MDKFYYYDYLLKHANKRDAELIDILKVELDNRIYYYGQHFRYPAEKYQSNILRSSNFKKQIKNILIKGLLFAKYFFSGNLDKNKKNILSNAYFTFNSELSKLGFNVIRPIWNIGFHPHMSVLPSISFFWKTLRMINILNNGKFNELLSESFKSELDEYISVSKDIYKKYIDALIIPYDMPAMEKIAIKAFKEIQKPSFVFLHGLPGRYNNLDENRTDYLIVWGEKIKQHYIDHGFSANKIFVSGHPYYNALKTRKLRFSLDNILVITKSVNGAQPCSDRLILSDRGNLIRYLFSLQSVLQKLGIKKVRFRPHPSENGLWYLQYIDTKFYKLENINFKDAVNNSSLLIGPTSTVLIETMYYGINYVIYEPVINNITHDGLPIVPPFDGTDNRLPVAKNEDELYDIIKNQKTIDTSIWDEYIKTPFDISFIKTLI
jgi:hypothetical protein